MQVIPVKTPSYPKVPAPVTRWPSKDPEQVMDPVSPPVVSVPELGERLILGERWTETEIKQSAAVAPCAFAGEATISPRKRAARQPTVGSRRTLTTPLQIRQNLTE